MEQAMTNKLIFEEYLKANFSASAALMQRFETYFAELLKANDAVNLFSRKMPSDEIWTKHFLDSLFPLQFMDLQNAKSVLDLGTGGGIPGIPLKLIYSFLQLDLLDARQKKTEMLKNFISALSLDNCYARWGRLEDFAAFGKYDLIVCRAVKMLPNYVSLLKKLLRKNGKIYLYKGKDLEDKTNFGKHRIIPYAHESLGERQLVVIS